jgi:UDP-2,3-diacylglucosamine hydrolase
MTIAATHEGPLGIICGSGSIPLAVAAAVQRRGRRVMLFALRGFVDAQAVAAYPHCWIAIGQFGRFRRLARAEGCRDLVLVGGLVRPAIRQVRLDWATVVEMPRIIRAFRGGDDHLLTGIGRILEGDGFRLLGAHEVAPDITAPSGALGRHQPDAEAAADIARGFEMLAAMSPFDVGQAVVIGKGHVLAVEAAEGTDAMLQRVVALREAGRIRLPRGAGVLVKAPKQRQDRRFDLPSIGPDTVRHAAQAGLAGIAVVAGGTIVAEPQRLVEAADTNGLFVLGRADREAG